MTYSEFIEPIIRTVLAQSDIKGLLGKYELYRNAFEHGYNLDPTCPKLEDMPKEDKVKLWEESLRYCPEFRLEWCKSWKFIESFM